MKYVTPIILTLLLISTVGLHKQRASYSELRRILDFTAKLNTLNNRLERENLELRRKNKKLAEAQKLVPLRDPLEVVMVRK